MNEEIFQFLRELRQNNNRPWFQENKGRYDVLRAAFIDEVQQLIQKIAVFEPEIAGLEAKDCIYRIYRDTRFSPDKTPYKNHFSAYIVRGGRGSWRSGYYFHLEPDNSMLSGGVWCPDPKLLKKLRQDIYENIDEFTGILENPEFKAVYPGLIGDTLKRMPVGFPADSPYGDILKHKDFCVYCQRPDRFYFETDWMNQAADIFKLLKPFNDFLNYTVDEYLGNV